jgi:hypothetical protein
MDKTQIFMSVTAFISIVSFNFNKIISYIIQLLCNNVYDQSILTYGPYYKSLPITIHYVYVDDELYTNRFRLFANWFWEFEIGGVCKLDLEKILLKSDERIILISYSHILNSKKIYKLVIDLKNNTTDIGGVVKGISFNQIKFLNHIYDKIV